MPQPHPAIRVEQDGPVVTDNGGFVLDWSFGPIDDPEAIGKGNGIGPATRYPDFVTIARGFGWNARSIVNKSDLVGALEEMIETPGPFLLDVAVPYQEHVLPKIPSGMTVRDVIKQ